MQAEVSYETEEEGTITLGNTNYAFVYQEDKTLVMEGQTNLSKDDLEENDVLMLDVVILSQDGTVRCMERYTGKIKTLYTTNANTLFCEIDTCEEEYFEKYHLRGLVENKVYKANPPVDYADYTASYSVDYTMDYLLGIGEEHTGYVMTTGEKITYDWTGAYSLFFKQHLLQFFIKYENWTSKLSGKTG